VQVLVSGALAGGRVSERLRGDLARLIRSSPEPDKQQLEAVLKNDPDFAKAATDAASDALALRQAFASNQFQQVLALSTDADPLLATDEEALLAFLSAAQLKEQAVMKRWADELLRRNPNEKTQSWITNIQAEAQ
jgi:hypothetical protein